MKRWLLPASALVLVVTACGAGAKPAPRVTAAARSAPLDVTPKGELVY